MTRKAWEDRIVGARMAADDEFAERVTASEFSRQEWGLVMTAVEFDVEHPEDPERARIVANTEKLHHVMPELDNISRQMGAMGGAGGGGQSGGGLLDSLKSSLGFGGGGHDAEREAAAARLAQEYAEVLQGLLEERGSWEEIRSLAAEEKEL